MIAVIGSDWVGPMGGGNRRIDDPADFVRLEVGKALKREGVRVIPVLVGGASPPVKGELPEDLASVTRRHALEISDGRWNYDVGLLVESVTAVVLDSKPAETERAAAAPIERIPSEPERIEPERVEHDAREHAGTEQVARAPKPSQNGRRLRPRSSSPATAERSRPRGAAVVRGLLERVRSALRGLMVPIGKRKVQLLTLLVAAAASSVAAVGILSDDGKPKHTPSNLASTDVVTLRVPAIKNAFAISGEFPRLQRVRGRRDITRGYIDEYRFDSTQASGSDVKHYNHMSLYVGTRPLTATEVKPFGGLGEARGVVSWRNNTSYPGTEKLWEAQKRVYGNVVLAEEGLPRRELSGVWRRVSQVLAGLA